MHATLASAPETHEINLKPSDTGLDLNGAEVRKIVADKQRLCQLLGMVVVFDRELQKGI